MNIWIFYCPRCKNPTYTENKKLKRRKCGHCGKSINVAHAAKVRCKIPSLKYAPEVIKQIYKDRLEEFYFHLKKEAERRFNG